ncbi:MAG: hypothetical protein Kow0080_05740 [Candidatus Promineifilaceae bacterium]
MKTYPTIPPIWQQPELLEEILESAHVLYITLDTEGKVLHANQTVTQLLGYSQKELTGQNWLGLCAPDAERWEQHQVFTQGLPNNVTMTLKAVTKSGETRYILWHRIKRIEAPRERPSIIAVGQDITTDVLAQQLSQKNRQLVNSLNIVSLNLIHSTNPNEIMQTLGKELSNLGYQCGLALFDEQHQHQLAVRYISLPEAVQKRLEMLLERPLRDIRINTPSSLNITLAEPGQIHDISLFLQNITPPLLQEKFTLLEEIIGLVPIKNIFRFPLKTRTHHIGILIIWGENLKQENLAIFQTFANQVAAALSNARTLEKELTARKQAETLQQVAAIINASLDIQDVLNRILEQLNRVIPYDSASVMLINGENVRIVARQGISSGIETGDDIKLNKLPGIVNAIQEKKPVIISDTRENLKWVRLPNDAHIRSWLGVPLITHSKIIGVLNLNKGETDYYKPADASLAMAFASQAALALQNATMFSQSQTYAEEMERRVAERTNELATLYDVTAVTSEIQELSEILERVLLRTLESLACTAGFVCLLDENDVLKLASVINLDEVWLPDTGELPGELMALMRETAVSGEISIHTDQHLPHIPQPITIIITPMRVERRQLGSFCVLANANRKFRVEEVALLASIADHTAVAVDNINLNNQAQQLAALKERERLARELHDSVTQQLYSLRLFADAAATTAKENDYGRTLSYIHNIDEIAHQTLKEMRLLLYELRSDTLLQNGLIIALRHRLDAVEQRAGVKTRLVSDETLTIPHQQEENLFRIAIEALNNALKHANAATVAIDVSQNDQYIIMTITDDGDGFHLEEAMKGSGMGLKNMFTRANYLQGTMDIHTQPGKGTQVIVKIPAP